MQKENLRRFSNKRQGAYSTSGDTFKLTPVYIVDNIIQDIGTRHVNVELGEISMRKSALTNFGNNFFLKRLADR